MSRNLQISSQQGRAFVQTEYHKDTPQGPRLNLNTATTEELERLPGIGPALAARIISQRERYGRFRRAEHLMMVRGMSEARFNAIRELVSVE